MTEPKMLTTAQAATRLGVDASTVGKYARHGLVIRRATRGQVELRLRLKASWIERDGRRRLGIKPSAVREFNARRGAR